MFDYLFRCLKDDVESVDLVRRNIDAVNLEILAAIISNPEIEVIMLNY